MFESVTSLHERLAIVVMDAVGAVVERDRLLPPFSMRRLVGDTRWELGGEEFRIQGLHFLAKLKEDAGLKSHTRLLDLGSGCGRIAIPLTTVLSSGRYAGLEPVPQLVRWCQRHITPLYPNFEFFHCDLYNRLYNPHGSINAEDFRFPFDDAEFDVVVATSVFTHLCPNAAKNYVIECSRVLEKHGRFFATFFLAENGTASHDGVLQFSHPFVGASKEAMVIDPDVPERAVAYHADWIISLCARHDLRLRPPIHLGSWTGRQSEYSGQDVLIFEKS